MKETLKHMLRSKLLTNPLTKLIVIIIITFLSLFGFFSLFYNYKEIIHFAVYTIGTSGARINNLNKEYKSCRKQYQKLNARYNEAKRKPDSLHKELNELKRLIEKNKIKFNKIIKLGIHGFKKELIVHTEWDRLTTIKRDGHELLSIHAFDFVDIDTINNALPEWYHYLLIEEEPWFRVQMLNTILKNTWQVELPLGTCEPAPVISKIWNSINELTIAKVEDTITCTHKPVYVRYEYWFSGRSRDNTWLCRAIPDMKYLESIGKHLGYIETILDSIVIEKSY